MTELNYDREAALSELASKVIRIARKLDRETDGYGINESTAIGTITAFLGMALSRLPEDEYLFEHAPQKLQDMFEEFDGLLVLKKLDQNND